MYPIPRNATRIEYLESDGSQWIDTGINGQSGLVINAKFWMQRDNVSVMTIFFGANNSATSPVKRYYVGVGNFRGAPRAAFYYHSVALREVNKDDGHFDISLNDNSALINKTSITTTASEFDSGLTMHVFGTNKSDGTHTTNSRPLRMKSFSVSKDGVMLCDYVPVRVGNVGCVFDRVTGQFIYGSGTGDFVCGPDDVSKFAHAVKHISKDDSKPYDAEAEYIESTGTQYIDTGIEPTTDMVTKVEFTILETNGSYGVVCSYPYNDGNDYRIFENRNADWKKIFHDRHGGRIYTNMYDSHHYVLEAGNLYMKDLTTGETMVSGSAASGSWGSSYTTRIFFNAASEKARVYWCQFYKNGQLVGDFIPVRVGNEYCLYDRANPTGGDNGDGLYHNKGTGAFLGKDKGKVMASRIKGKENELPYDAEVEYIENTTAGQYIDSDTTYEPGTKFQVAVLCANMSTGRAIICGNYCGNGCSFNAEFKADGSARGYVQVGGHTADMSSSALERGVRHRIIVYHQSGIALLAVNGSTVDTRTGVSGTGTNTNPIRFFLDYRSGTGVKGPIRLYDARIHKDGVLVQHFIPVRVGNEYCLYDKLNPTGGDNGDGLYHNKGSGAFLGGADKPKIKPVRKHYDLATYYTIDECNGNTPTMVNANFPSDKYDALDYTPTWEHHRFLGWYDRPYDAEIEYLESSGTQWIDTGVLPTTTTIFTIDGLFPCDKSGASRLGSRQSDGSSQMCLNTVAVDNDNRLRLTIGNVAGTHYFPTPYNTGATSITFDAPAKMASATLTNGSTGSYTYSNVEQPSPRTLCLFAMHASDPITAFSLSNNRVSSSIIKQNGTRVRDFVPVRIGTTGALYDKVNGITYWNNGTGEFIKGSDTSSFASVQVLPSDQIVFGRYKIYARWQVPTTVTFDATTGGGQMPGGWTAPDYYEGQPFGTLPTPTHSTLNFSGWYDGSGNKVTESTIVTANNKALTAQYSAQSYTVDISNGDWELEDPNTNPDTSAYDGVYRNLRYWNSPPGAYVDKLYIDVIGYTSFTVYIRSYAEVNYSYTVAVKADYDPTSFTDAINNKQGATTANNSSTGISAYTAVTYTLDGGSHRICIAYGHKDSIKQNADRGYLLIPKQQ